MSVLGLSEIVHVSLDAYPRCMTNSSGKLCKNCFEPSSATLERDAEIAKLDANIVIMNIPARQYRFVCMDVWENSAVSSFIVRSRQCRKQLDFNRLNANTFGLL